MLIMVNWDITYCLDQLNGQTQQCVCMFSTTCFHNDTSVNQSVVLAAAAFHIKMKTPPTCAHTHSQFNWSGFPKDELVLNHLESISC